MCKLVGAFVVPTNFKGHRMNISFTNVWHILLYLLLGIVFLPLYFCAFLIDKILGLEEEEWHR